MEKKLKQVKKYNTMKKITAIICSLFLLILIATPACAQFEKKPIIGVSASSYETSGGAPATYIEAIKRAGGVPLVIPMTTDDSQLLNILEVIDGLVMTGGEDICPSYYGEEPLRALGEIVPFRDEFDYKLIKMAVDKGLPVLGICRGEQIMNVVFGGTLYQDIPSQKKDSYIKHRQNAPRVYGTHSINIEKGSLLEKQVGKNKVNVNSYHHQAVKDVAPGFKATAYSQDGVVEAIEMIGNNKVWGVQFHPEGPVSGGNDNLIGIFKYLIEQSK